MKRWVLTFTLAVAIIGCDRLSPGPTPTPTAAPTLVPAPTQAPSATPLPPTATLEPTQAPTVIVTAPTVTTAPTDTPTVEPTKTRVRQPVSPKPTPTNTGVVLKYPAPTLIEPGAPGTSFTFSTNNDLVFKWQPVADLSQNECYLITVWFINVQDQRYSPFTQLIGNSCASVISGGNLKFTLNRPKFGPPNYAFQIADAEKFTPTQVFRVRWWVQVVITDGTPLSPPSAQYEFTLQSQ